MKTCQFCTADVGPTNNYCPSCGKNLQATAVTEENKRNMFQRFDPHKYLGELLYSLVEVAIVFAFANVVAPDYVQAIPLEIRAYLAIAIILALAFYKSCKDK